MKRSRLVRLASEAVAATQRELPEEIRAAAMTVPVRIEDSPEQDPLAEGLDPDLLGLFTGSALGEETGSGQMPPQICLYTANLWDYAEGSEAGYRREVRLTYLHELGHFLGWDEGQLEARGLD